MNNTAVARGRFVDGAAPKVENVQVIFHQAPSLASPLHFGGRLVFNRDGTLFITLGDRSITEGRMQAQQHGRPDRQDRAPQRGRLDPQGQSVRRQGRRAAGDLVVRPPQHPGGDAAPARPASCGKSSTARAAATR